MRSRQLGSDRPHDLRTDSFTRTLSYNRSERQLGATGRSTSLKVGIGSPGVTTAMILRRMQASSMEQ